VAVLFNLETTSVQLETPPHSTTLRVALAVATTALGVVIAPPAIADAGCGPGGPPPGAASKAVSGVYGQPATLWLTNQIVGIITAQGYGEAAIHSPSPVQRRALLIDAQQDGNHQIIVDTGREALLYAVSGCTITDVVDQQGAPFLFDIGHRRGTGDGVSCSDLGDGPYLVGMLVLPDGRTWRLTEIDLNGATATIGRSDTVPALSDLSCGGLTMERDGLWAP
jgi:hypothetical protein